MFILLSTVSMAQFKSATIVETQCVSSSGQASWPFTYQTSNDIFIGAVHGTPIEFSVVAWAGLNGGNLHWRLKDNTGTYTDILNMPYNMGEVDVCILLRPNNWFVLVAYNDAGIPKLLAQRFDPVLKTWSFVSNTTLGNGNIIQTNIKIDSDQAEHFFVVWDQLNSIGQQKIFGAAGGIINNTVAVCMTSYEFPLFNDPISGSPVNPPYLFPDVAVMEMFTSGATTTQMQARLSFVGSSCSAYPNAISLVCIANDFKTTNWTNCTFTPLSSNLNYIKPAPLGTTYLHPKIARHRRAAQISNLQEGFTVVWSAYHGASGLADVMGFTVFYDYVTNAPNLNIITTDNTYTDGTCVFNNLNPPQNLPNISQWLGGINIYPTISYEKKSGLVNPNANQIMCIGFNYVSPTTSLLSCASFYARNSDGRPFCTQINNQNPNYYYQVPTNVSDRCFGLAISGELSESFLYSWTAWPANSNAYTHIWYKIVQAGANLKSGNAENTNVNFEILNDNFISINLSQMSKIISIIDIQGKAVLNADNVKVSDLKELNRGYYLLSYLNLDGKTNTTKVFKL